MINSYVALDLETSGLNPSRDRIIEIGMARIIEGEIVEQYSQLIDPQVELISRIEELTGIDSKMLIGKPRIQDLIEDIVSFIGDAPILGHNIIFDYSFLKTAAVNQDIAFEKQGIDTLKIARRILPEVEHKNLEYLCSHFGIDAGNSHRALDDAISAKKLYDQLYLIAPQDCGFSQLSQLQFAVKKQAPITQAQQRYLSSLLLKHNIELREEITAMTKSGASRMIDQILSEYGRS